MSTLLVWGTVSGDGIRLEPVFDFVTAPSLPHGGGRYTVEGRDAYGAVLFSHPFEPSSLAHGTAGEGGFAFAIPVDFPRDRLAELRVSGAGRSAVRGGAPTARSVPAGGQPADPPGGETRVERRAPGVLAVEWPAAHEGAALVIDSRTGEIIAIARHGSVRVRSDATTLELHLSDGLGSRRSVVQVR